MRASMKRPTWRERPGRMNRHLTSPIALIVLSTAFMVFPSTAMAQNDPIVARGIKYLRDAGGGGVGESALSALAMIKAEVPNEDPTLSKFISVLQSRFSSSAYLPEKGSGAEIYEASVVLLALANHDPVAHRNEIDAAAQFLISRQNANGSWDYQNRTAGDTSISQYAVLGLWEAENAGIGVNPSIWDRAASWFLSTQSSAGSWTYHRDTPEGETVAMTAAGVGSLLICNRQLAPYRIAERAPNPLLIPLASESDRKRYSAEVSPQRLNNGIRGGIGWLSANFTTGSPSVIGKSPYYALYGIERLGALADQATLGRVDWFNEGKRYIASTQRADGAFSSQFGDGPNTAWAVLFVTKSTAKTIKKIQIRRLGSGTLVGGRGLPKDLSQVSIAGGKVVARPMDGAVEGMLAALEDPRVEDAGSALAGLVARYGVEGPKALRPHEERFRKLLADRDQGVRRVAAWALARTGDQGMVPHLIAALMDPDDGVVREARLGLQLQARMIDGFGPLDGASREDKERAAAKWQAWYESVRPINGPSAEARPETPKADPNGRKGL